MWPLPRELLWAIIVALAIAVVSLWPLKYPYRQAPSIQTQQQTKDSVGGHDATQHGPAAPVDATGEQKDQHGGEHASEVMVLGIKPGEWLLGIVTWMLWLATARLVTNADKNSERQLRAYVGLSKAEITKVETGAPEVVVIFQNFGQTPAHDVQSWIHIWIAEYPLTDTVLPEPSADFRKSSGVIYPGAQFIHAISKEPSVRPWEIPLLGTQEGTIYVYGRIRYRDAFNESRTTNFRLIYGGTEPTRGNLLKHDQEGNEAD